MRPNNCGAEIRDALAYLGTRRSWRGFWEESKLLYQCWRKIKLAFERRGDKRTMKMSLSLTRLNLFERSSAPLYEVSIEMNNRPVSYSNCWTGSSMKWRLMQAN